MKWNFKDKRLRWNGQTPGAIIRAPTYTEFRHKKITSYVSANLVVEGNNTLVVIKLKY